MFETVRYTYRLRPGRQAVALDASFKVKGRGRPKVEAAIGVDWGVTTTATTTDAAFDLPHLGHRGRRRVVLVPPAYTTMTCSQCATRAKERLGLGLRVFECPQCGFTADRDLNAARTILATAERVCASADDVRHAIASFRDGGSDAVRAGNPPDSSVGSR